MAQGFSALSGADLDLFSTGAAGRFDGDIRTKHSGDTESIDCTDRMKSLAAKLYAVFGPFPGEGVSIKDDV
jgi:hypothetical protein